MTPEEQAEYLKMKEARTQAESELATLKEAHTKLESEAKDLQTLNQKYFLQLSQQIDKPLPPDKPDDPPPKPITTSDIVNGLLKKKGVIKGNG